MKSYKISLQGKLLIWITIFFVIPFTVIGLFWYHSSTKTIEANAARHAWQMTNQIKDRLDDYFDTLDRNSLSIALDSAVYQFMLADSDDAYGMYQAKRKVQTDVFLELLSNYPDVLSLSVVRKDGQVATSRSEYSAIDAYLLYDHEERMTDRQHIHGIRELPTGIVLTVTRDIIDPKQLISIGMLVIDLNYSKIADILKQEQLSEHDFIWIVGPNDRVIYHPDSGMLGQPAVLPEEADFTSMDDTFRDYVKVAGQMKVYNYMEKTGWTMIAEMSVSELTEGLVGLRNRSIAVGTLLILLAFMVLGGIVWSLSRSLLILQRLMTRAEQGNLQVRAPAHSTIQIDQLYSAFNRMVGELKRLIEVVHLSRLKEKEAEIRQVESKLRVTQSQINPHFLYNVLEVVNSYAIEYEVKPVSRMVTAIAKMFRYNIGDPNQSVSLAQEIEHIRIFLEIQQERYGNLHVSLEVDPEQAARVAALRLILQPLVENIFIHAYEAHGRMPDNIHICGETSPDLYKLQICDQGLGMPEHVREDYNRRFQSVTVKDIINESPTPKGASLGLWNVHSRLRLAFGERCGLWISKSDPSGTTIEVRLPWRNQLPQEEPSCTQ